MSMTSSSRMPAVFIGHGSPMNALEHNRFTDAWRSFASSIPRPRAVLSISAHWYIRSLAVTAMPTPRTIHDFGGFPDELFRVEYPAPGDPALAARVIELLDPLPVARDSTWGLDHGTWSVLAPMFPAADVPVVQLSIDATRSFEEQVAIGAALAPLRDEGVLILGSGDIVHNLGLMDWGRPEGAFPWAKEFDDAAKAILTSRPAELPSLSDHPGYSRAVPTPDHFIPALYLAGLAEAADTTAKVLFQASSFGSISMTSYVVRD